MLHKNILPFLSELTDNNNKAWFEQNKPLFLQAKEDFSHFIDLLIAKINEFDPLLKGLKSKDCIFRIYRDVRFSKDKKPYKTHFGAYMAPGGRKSMNTGYYIHIDPALSFIAGGIYMPQAEQLKAIRINILEDTENIIEIIENDEFKENFTLYNADKIKTAPRGFPKDFEHIDLLRYKHYVPTRQLDINSLKANNYFEILIDYFEIIKPFNDYIRECLS